MGQVVIAGKTLRAALVAALLACLLLGSLLPAAARATHHVTAFSLTVADPQAGASVNASSATSLSYDNLTEDVKKTIGHFAAGMLANPEAVPHCPQANYLTDTCPPDTFIGTSEADLAVAGVPLPSPTATGRIYNQELLAGEAGRLGIIIDSTPKTFLTAPFYVRTNGDYGLDGVLDDLPRALAGFVEPVQIKRLSFTLFGTVQGRNYTRAPTSCSLKVSTGEAFGYDDTSSVSGPSSSYTPTGCAKLPFKPTFDISAGSPGENGFNAHPPLSVTVTQQPGEAGVLSNAVTLPTELTPNVAAFTTICSEAQLAGGACPAAAQVGTTRATSPFLATPLSGPVWLVQKAGTVLPALVADLRGRVPVKITIQNGFVGGRQIKSTTTAVPDLPIGSFSLTLNGGSKGVLLNKTNLCFQGNSSSRFRDLKAAVGFTSHSGASIASSPHISIAGCQPGLRASVKRARRPRPSVTVTLQRHPDGAKIQRARLTLPRDLQLVRKRVRRNVSGQASAVLGRGAFRVVGRRTLSIAGISKQGASTVVVRLRGGAVKASKRLRRALRKHRKKRLGFTVVSTDTAGKSFTSRTSVRVRR